MFKNYKAVCQCGRIMAHQEMPQALLLGHIKFTMKYSGIDLMPELTPQAGGKLQVSWPCQLSDL